MSDINQKLLAQNLLGVQADAKDMQLYSSILGALPNPDKILEKLNMDITAYYDLEYDDQVSAALQLRKDNVRSMNWELQPSKNREDIYKFIYDVIKKWDMEKIIGEMLNAIPYGYSVLEKIWLRKNDRSYYVSAVVGKPPHWFKFDSNNRVRFMSNKGSQVGIPLSRMKFTVVQNYPSYLNPYGTAIYSKCFWPVKFKRGGMKFFAKFVEKFGMILLVGQVNKNGDGNIASKKDTDEMLQTLDGLFQDNVAAIPGTDEIISIAGNSESSSNIYLGFLEYCDKQISKAVLSHSSAVDSVAGELGNKDQVVDSINIIRDSDAKLVTGNINEIISQMVEVNFGSDIAEEDIPTFELIARGKASDTMQWVERDSKLYALGVKFTKDYIKEQYNLSEKDFELLVSEPPNNGQAEFSVQEDMETKLASKFQNVIEPIIEMVRKGKSFDEIKTSLIELNKDLDTSELEEFISDVIAVTMTEESE